MNTFDVSPLDGDTGSNERPTLSQAEFDLLRTHIREISGIDLDNTKTALIQSRLGPLLERYGCRTYSDLYRQSRTTAEVNDTICNAISTNETSFFRDRSVFEMIATHLIPSILNRTNHLRVWSAAASTGQEAYSIAMLAHELLADPTNYEVHIEGTDISHDAVAYASYGSYTRFEVNRGVSDTRRWRFFEPLEEGHRVVDRIRYLTHFRQLNLLAPLPAMERFDLILCRNVAIYFSRETKRSLFESLATRLAPGGILVLGATESLWQVTELFRRHEFRGLVYYSLATDDLNAVTIR